MIYVYIGLLCLVVATGLGALYLKKKKAKALKALIKKVSSDASENERAQSKMNIEFIYTLIKGHRGSHVSSSARNKSINQFGKWQEKISFLFRIATPEMIALRNNYIEGKLKLNAFKFTSVQKSPCLAGKKRPEGWQLFCKDGFTDPFPSFHDMDDWAVATKLADFFIVNGITPKESEKFVFHKKRHYVNHEMAQGIIQFDLYKMP